MQYTYVCNWKMVSLSYSQQEQFFISLKKRLLNVSYDAPPILIFAPSFVHLERIHTWIQENDLQSSVALAGQDCSQFSEGAFTGDTSALFLKESGCRYCIVGHVERRKHHQEDDALVVRKIVQLASMHITPIICIGALHHETMHEVCIRISDQLTWYRKQLEYIPLEKLYFAYEPHSSVDGMLSFKRDELAAIMEHMHVQLNKLFDNKKVVSLYGGGVDERLIQMLQTIPFIDGFLIGRASIDFQKLEKIIF